MRSRRVVIAVAVVAAVAAGIGVAWETVQKRNEVYDQAARLTGGDPRAGGRAIMKYGCGGCHEIAGIPAARGRVGPPLTGIAQRGYLAGRLSNNAPNMIGWIQHPQQIQPGTAMPNMGVTEEDARDIAAYLYTLQ